MYEDLRELIARGEAQGPRRRRLELPARHRPLQGGRDGDRRRAPTRRRSPRSSARTSSRSSRPTAHIEQAEAKKVFEKYQIPIETLADRVRHVVQATFNGKRIVIFSGGEAKGTDAVLAEVRELAAGGAFGSIMGRNAFQRPRAEALKLLADVMNIYKTAGRRSASQRARQRGATCRALSA